MRIISLNGRPECGKTHTLLDLCDMLAKTAVTANRSKAAPKWTLEGYAHDNGQTLNKIVMPYANFLKLAAWTQVQHLVAKHIYEMVMKYAGEEKVEA